MSDAVKPRSVCSGRVWLDVGGLLRLKGSVHGIPRTIQCLARHWRGDDRLTILPCGFDRSRRRFRHVASKDLDERVAAPASSAAENHKARGGKPLAPQAPGEWQQARGHFWQGFKALGRLLRLQRLWPERIPLGAMADFHSGDILFLGAGWSERGYVEALRHIRAQASVKMVMLLYDLMPCKMPHCFAPDVARAFQDWFKNAMPLTDLVLAISRQTRSDALDELARLGAAVPPIEVIRLGDDVLTEVPSQRPPGAPDDFVLFVSTIEPRKNHQLLYQVWRRLVERHGAHSPSLVFAGRAGWQVDDLIGQIARDPLVQDKIVLLSGASDAEIRWLYEHCRFTLYPSHGEGWGLPVAESLRFGKFCIASSAAPLPEIAGDLLDYHDPLDALGCLGLVERALFEPGYISGKEEGLRSYRGTSWKTCAEETLGLLVQAAAATPSGAAA